MNVANGCTSTATISVNFTTGISDLESIYNIHVYPNPTSENLAIEMLLPASTDITFTLFDVVGVKVFSESSIETGAYKKQFSLQTLPSGVYFLNMGVGGKNTTHKIIKY